MTLAAFDNVPVAVELIAVHRVRDRAAWRKVDRIVDVGSRRAVVRISGGAAGGGGRPACFRETGGEIIQNRGPGDGASAGAPASVTTMV